MPTDAGTASALLMPGTISTGDARGPHGLQLLAAPAEEERVAALEPDHGLSLLRPVHHQGLDLVLFEDMLAAIFPAVDLLGFFGKRCEDLLAGELVEEDDVGRIDHFAGPLREKALAARSRSHEIHFPGHRVIPSCA